LALRGVNYLWKIEDFPKNNFDTTLQIGFIAQEVEKIVPEVVRTDEKGFKSVEYSKVVALLIEALKEQQKIIEQQKSDISNLKSDAEKIQKDAERIQKLETDMANLKLLLESLNKDSKPPKNKK
jgi:cell shape-determining protein MreC